MKIAFLSDAIYPYHLGGKEARLYEISTRLAKRGHDVTIYCMSWWGDLTPRVENGVKLVPICKNKPLYTKTGRRSIAQGLYWGWHAFKVVKYDYDVLDVDHMPQFGVLSARLATWIRRKKMVTTVHEVWGKKYWKEYLGWKGYFGYLIEKMSILFGGDVVCISTLTASRIGTELGINKARTIITPGIDVKQMENIRPRKSGTLIYSGRLIQHKNIDLIICAMAALPNHTLCIVGEGPDLERLKQTARKQGVLNRVQFRKTCRTKDEAYQLIKGAKVFIHPSTREGFGMVVLESIALNTPVVTTDHPENAARTIVTKRSGVLSQPSTKSFVKAVRKAEKLTKSAIAKDAKPYEWSTIVRRHEKIYAE